MPIIKKLNDNKYIDIYKKDSINIQGKTALYHSTFDEKYKIITDVKIIKDNDLVYEANNLHIAYDKKGLISIVDYTEKIAMYVLDSTFDPYWGGIFLDSFFKDGITSKLEMFYRSKIRYQKEKGERQGYKQKVKKIDELKKKLKDEYNKKGYAVAEYDAKLYIFKNVIYKNKNWTLIDNQDNDYLIMDLVNNDNYKDIIIASIGLYDSTTIEKLENQLHKLKELERGDITA